MSRLQSLPISHPTKLNESTQGFVDYLNSSIELINQSAQIIWPNDENVLPTYESKITQLAHLAQLIEISIALLEKNLSKALSLDHHMRDQIEQKLVEIKHLRNKTVTEMNKELHTVLLHPDFGGTDLFIDLSTQQIFLSFVYYYSASQIQRQLWQKFSDRIALNNKKVLQSWQQWINNIVYHVENYATSQLSQKTIAEFISNNATWRESIIKFYAIIKKYKVIENTYRRNNQLVFEKVKDFKRPVITKSGLSEQLRRYPIANQHYVAHSHKNNKNNYNSAPTNNSTPSNRHNTKTGNTPYPHSAQSNTTKKSTIGSNPHICISGIQPQSSTVGIENGCNKSSGADINLTLSQTTSAKIPFDQLPEYKKAAIAYIDIHINKLMEEIENSTCLCLFDQRKTKKQDGLHHLKSLIITNSEKNLKDLVDEVRKHHDWNKYIDAGFFSGGIFSFKSRTQKILDTLMTVDENNYHHLGDFSPQSITVAYLSCRQLF